jgi:hypothetical protein
MAESRVGRWPFRYGFALPIPALLAIVRLVLTALAWRTTSNGGSAGPSPAVCESSRASR